MREWLRETAKLFMVLAAAVALVQLAKIHRHLHALECAVRGEITDSDYSRWPDSDAICPKVNETTGDKRE